MHDALYLLAVILVMFLATYATRYMPFLIFKNKGSSEIIMFFGNLLPGIIILLLVIYSLKSITLTSSPFGLPEILSSLTVAALHMVFRNSLLSIFAGTGLYMFLKQAVFL